MQAVPARQLFKSYCTALMAIASIAETVMSKRAYRFVRKSKRSIASARSDCSSAGGLITIQSGPLSENRLCDVPKGYNREFREPWTVQRVC
jgi:hypothetical protein